MQFAIDLAVSIVNIVNNIIRKILTLWLAERLHTSGIVTLMPFVIIICDGL